jgi:hypothetical protein
MTLSAARFRLASAALLLALVAQLPGCGQEPGRESGASDRGSVGSDPSNDPSSDPSSERLTDGELAERALAERDFGPKRDDLSRFKGRYADPNRANEHHVWSVGETCVGSGHLALAAMWGDVAPWRLASESDLVFTEPYPQPNYEPFRLSFQAAPDGSITAALMSGPFEARLERLGDLPEGWEPEGEDCLYR